MHNFIFNFNYLNNLFLFNLTNIFFLIHDKYRKHLEEYGGLLTIKLKIPIYNPQLLSLVYTPGVGASCKKI